MGGVVAALLPLAAVVAISPVPIVAVVLMLLAPEAGRTGAGFLVGWVVGIAGVSTAVLLLTGVDPAGSDKSSSAASWVQLVLGAAALLLAAKQWRSRPKPGEAPALPRWMAAIDRCTAVRAGGLGLVLSAMNPKALLVCVAAGTTIAGSGLSTVQAAWCMAFFTVIAVSTVALPVLAYAVGGAQMTGRLAALRSWLTVHSAPVTAAVLLVVGVVLIGQGLSGLA